MRKASYTVRCDNPGCHKIGDVDEGQTPEGWYNVRQADGSLNLAKTTAGTFDLCSLKCMRIWSKARDTVLTGNNGTATAYIKEPCPFCDDGSVFAPQGMVRHIDVTHGAEFVQMWREGRGTKIHAA